LLGEKYKEALQETYFGKVLSMEGKGCPVHIGYDYRLKKIKNGVEHKTDARQAYFSPNRYCDGPFEMIFGRWHIHTEWFWLW
jgi:hypothetical protein